MRIRLSNPPFTFSSSQDPGGGEPVPRLPDLYVSIFRANPASPAGDVVIRFAARSRNEPVILQLRERLLQTLKQLDNLPAEGPAEVILELPPLVRPSEG